MSVTWTHVRNGHVLVTIQHYHVTVQVLLGVSIQQLMSSCS